jgi:outer membrane protein W
MRLILFLFFTGVFIQPAAHAQFTRGDKMVGASLASVFANSGSSTVSFEGFSGYTAKTSSYGVRIEPSVGWFVSDKTAVGFILNVNPTGRKERYSDAGTTFQEDRSKSFSIGAGVFIRNYFSANGAWMPFGQAGVNGGISSTTTEGFRFYSVPADYKVMYEGEASGSPFVNASLQAGVTKMLGENAGLDFSIGYTYSYNKNTMKTVTTTDSDLDGDIDITSTNEPTTKFTNHGFFVGVGFQVFLRKQNSKK